MIKGLGLTVPGLVSAILFVALLPGCSTSDGKASSEASQALQAGQCVRVVGAMSPQGGTDSATQTVACNTKHHGEVVLADESYFKGDKKLPADDQLTKRTDATCSDAMKAYSGRRPEQTPFRMMVLYPTQDSWASGDRKLTCVAFGYDTQFDSLSEVEGSIHQTATPKAGP